MKLEDVANELDRFEEDFDNALKYIVDFAEKQSVFNHDVTRALQELKDAMLEIAKDVDQLNAEAEVKEIKVYTPIGGNGGIH